MGERYRDAELTTLARIGEGRCLIYLGEIADGRRPARRGHGRRRRQRGVRHRHRRRLLHGDRGMPRAVRRRAGRTSGPPRSAGGATANPSSCSTAGSASCTGPRSCRCEAHWDDALEELDRALARLAEPASPADPRRARPTCSGDSIGCGASSPTAEDAYRAGRRTGPRTTAGARPAAAGPGTGRRGRRPPSAGAEQEAEDPLTRARLLGPYVEIVLAAGDVDAARVGGRTSSRPSPPSCTSRTWMRSLPTRPAWCSCSPRATRDGRAGDAPPGVAGLAPSSDAPYEAARSRVQIALRLPRPG